MAKIYFSNIDKDMRRVLGKKLYNHIKEEKGFIVAERSDGSAEYHLNMKGYYKVKFYMTKHKKSRLAKAWTGCKDGYNVRFDIDSWQ